MGVTVGRPATFRANPEEQESNRTPATPAVDSSIAGETRHTVIEPRTCDTIETVNPDDRRPEPVQLFPDDSQLPDLGLSGDSNLWQDGYSYRQNDRENNRNSRKGYSTNTKLRRQQLFTLYTYSEYFIHRYFVFVTNESDVRTKEL